MSTKSEKPAKPYQTFPLFAHANGQWAKKIRGKLYYFGVWDDPGAALDLYQRTGDAIQAGQSISLVDSVTLERAAEGFLVAKRAAVESGEISLATWREYQRSCKRMATLIDKKRACNSLNAYDFTTLREGLVKQCSSPKTLKNELTRIKVFLRWAYLSRTVDQPLPYELALKPPSARLLRSAKKKGNLFLAEEIRTLVEAASGYLKPAILLGINSGFGNRDVCELEWSHIDGSMVDFARNKTGVARRASLWPETMAALEDWRKERASKWVCSGRYSQSLVSQTGNTPIAHDFRELMNQCSLVGRGFYCLRRTYRTIADEQGDQPAIMLTMGHEDRSMNGVYRQGISVARLESVADHVRSWLYAM